MLRVALVNSSLLIPLFELLHIAEHGLPALPPTDALVVDIEVSIDLTAVVVVPLDVATDVAIDAVEGDTTLK